MSVMETTTPTTLELQAARDQSDRLFATLTEQALYERPIAQRHRVLFYIGHLDGFDAIQICREGLGVASPDPKLDDLFQAGIDPDAGHLPADQPQDWPSLKQVYEYMARCRMRVDRCLQNANEDTVHMALEHRLMHLETLAYMFHNFDYQMKRPPEDLADQQTLCRQPAANTWIEIPEGIATLGRNEDGGFGWDNEYLETKSRVPAFLVQRRSVTNGEYLRFVEQGAPLPNFWTRRGNRIFYRGMFAEVPLPLDWPVYVTQREAAAYANSLKKSLPTEEQFHRAAFGTWQQEERNYPWESKTISPQNGNFDFARWEPEPVDSRPKGRSAFGVDQLVGNGWQWTSSIFKPFEGFRNRPSYPGYSANFFDGDHYVMKGGSARTSARLLRRSFRNWFRSDYPYVYATFRCVEN
jgi:gamma-glutamyl hercynylcysteine S-oxide synthase